MRLIIISGLSGSGKSVALHTLEDAGYYCIDNLPTGLLTPLLDTLRGYDIKLYDRIAVGIDARSDPAELQRFPEQIAALRKQGIEVQVLFIDADLNTLIRRFSETRRKHPLSHSGVPLIEAIEIEQNLLADISTHADFYFDTTQTSVHELRQQVRDRLQTQAGGLTLLFQSFGFKHGLPRDTDFVFDVRCLPNPYWEIRLRNLPGHHPEVIKYLQAHGEVEQMFSMIRDFLQEWLPRFQRENRSYVTVAIGCTGGQHRSVYLAECLYQHFHSSGQNVSLRHRDCSE